MDDAGGGARLRYLRAAAEMAAGTPKHPVDVVAASITPAALADALGIGRTQLYRWWSTRADLTADAVAYLAATDRRECLTATALDLGDDRALAAVAERVRTQLNRRQAVLIADPWLCVRTELATSCLDRQMAAILATRWARVVQALTNQVEVLIAFADRVIVEPFTPKDVAIAVACLADGVAVAAQLDPRLAARRIAVADRGWSVLAHGTWSILLGCSRPRHGNDPTPALEWTGQLPPCVSPPEPTGPRRAALDAAARLYLDDRTTVALDGPTIDQVARRCGVTRQAVHRYWSSQAELAADVRRVLYRADGRWLVETVRAGLRATRGAPDRALEVAIGVLAAACTGDGPPPAQWLFAGRHHPTVAATGADALGEATAEIVAEIHLATAARPVDDDDLGDRVLVGVLAATAAGRLRRIEPALLRSTLDATPLLPRVLARSTRQTAPA